MKIHTWAFFRHWQERFFWASGSFLGFRYKCSGHFLRLCGHILLQSSNLYLIPQSVPHTLSGVSYCANSKCAGKSRPWRIQRWVKRSNLTTWVPSSRAVQISILCLCGGRVESTCFSVPKCFSNPSSKYFKWFHHVLFDSELYISKFSKKSAFKAETDPETTPLICLGAAHFAQKSCFSAKYR